MTDREFQIVKNQVKILMEKTIDPLHSFKHGERVARYAEHIAEITGTKKWVDINLLKVACLVHDVPISTHGFTIIHHFLEPWFVRRDMPGILNEIGVTGREAKVVLKATINHAYSYPYRKLHRWSDNYTKILQDADTLDLFSPERQETLNKNTGFSLTYRELSIFARIYFRFGAEYLAWYLNFPEAARHIGEIYEREPILKDEITFGKRGKIAVLVHGFPEPIYPETPLYSFFVNRGYTVIAPYLFNPRFKLSQKEVVGYIEGELKGKKPDVIVGVSMGGLLAPALAEKYPNAKLILIGTGPFIKPVKKSLNILVSISQSRFFDLLYKIIELMPTPIYSYLYKLFNHPRLSKEKRIELEDHIIKNWECIKSISEEEDREAIRFLTTVDNSILLHSLKNKTLIFAAGNDSMMPISLSQKLNSLIHGSKLVITKGKIHFTVFDKDNYGQLNNFLHS